MRPVMQQNLVGPHEDPMLSGDCMRACAASLFEEHAKYVPHFAAVAGPMAWWEEFRSYHRSMGFDVALSTEVQVMAVLNDPSLFPGYAYASVPSPRGPWHHVVLVGPDGLIAHDPYPGPTSQVGEIPDADEWWIVCAKYEFPGGYIGAAS